MKKSTKSFLYGIGVFLSFILIGTPLSNWEPENLALQAILSFVRFPLFIIWWPIIGVALLMEAWEAFISEQVERRRIGN